MDDALIIAAFERGVAAARNDKTLQSNPYAPESEKEAWEAFIAGYNHAEPKYRITFKGLKLRRRLRK